MVTRLTIPSTSREQLINVTSQVSEIIRASAVQSGVVTLFVPHTTAAITINENADPDVVSDMLQGLRDLAPRDAAHHQHAEGNSDAHLKASLVGNSVQLLIEDGALLLGTWQAAYFCEFDGPRSRKLWIKIAAD